MENISQDLNLKKIRDRLNAEKIKLWLQPYTTESKDKGIVPTDLIEKYSQDLSLEKELVTQLLEELRLHALSKLAERDKFQTEGLATLRVKVNCPLPTESPSRKPFPVECHLSVLGSDLKSLIAAARNDELSPELLKLICKGRVLDENKSLEEQGVKHGNDIMAMCMTSSEAKLAQREAEIVAVERTRKAAELLSTRGDDDDFYDVQIADQGGKPINLPKEEKRALTVAMTLHEKGRVALKQKKNSHALLLLLEADSEFNKCNSDILQRVDNYAILCLDIVWCYLQLKNLDQLPDAERRLNMSESCFKRSYGEKMERLTALKGGTGTEQALFMRLYLLQGIVAFHKGKLIDAQGLFRRAEFVLALLHIDEDHLNQVMLMGFSEKEARLGLRARHGNVNQAVDHIMEKRKEIEENNAKARAEWKQRVLGKKLGKTADGRRVNVEAYKSLVGMEFGKGASAEALRQCNNDIGMAVEYLHTHPELLSLPDPESKEKKKPVTNDMIREVVALGFDESLARQVLQQFEGRMEKAVEELLANGGVLPPLPPLPSSPSSSTSSAALSSVSSSSHSSTDSSWASLDPNEDETSRERRKKRRKELEEKIELETLVSDMEPDTNDHLDLALTDEKDILYTYHGMTSSLIQQQKQAQQQHNRPSTSS